jgi:hypothetical protein
MVSVSYTNFKFKQLEPHQEYMAAQRVRIVNCWFDQSFGFTMATNLVLELGDYIRNYKFV